MKEYMRRLISSAAVTIALLCMTSVSSAADPNRAEPKAAKSAGKSSQQEADYVAAVGKCESMQPKEKQSCIESAKERYGEMLR